MNTTSNLKQQWRQAALLGLFFCATSVNGMLMSAVIFGFSSQTLENSIQGRHQPVFDDPTRLQYPLIMLLVAIEMLAFVFAPIFQLVRMKLFIPAQAVVMNQLLTAFNMGAVVMGLIIGTTFAYTQLYPATQAEARQLTLLTIIAIYFYFVVLSVAITLFGLSTYRRTDLPSWLGQTSLAVGIVSLVATLLSPYPDFPPIRYIIGAPLTTLEMIIWAAYLWAMSVTPTDPEKTTRL